MNDRNNAKLVTSHADFPFLEKLQSTGLTKKGTLLNVYLIERDEFFSKSLLEGDSGGPGCGWEKITLYVVRHNELEEVSVNRTPRIIYPAQYLHPDEDYPPDDMGSSEEITSALARVDLSGVDYIVLRKQYYGSVMVEDSDSVFILKH
jgi:hypothetical protein